MKKCVYGIKDACDRLDCSAECVQDLGGNGTTIS